ncbi:MAG: nitrilase-related carbon-nitrogen hydrolase [Terriglobia bacterium]
MKRREFLKSSVSLGTLAGFGFAGTRVDGSPRGTVALQGALEGDGHAGRIGRPVRVVSIGYNSGITPFEKVAKVIDNAGSRGVDLIALPECCRGQNDHGSEESLSGPTVTAMAALAKKHRTYIVCPIDRRDGTRRLNTSVLLDRKGEVAGIYDKIFPWFPEFHLSPPVNPGQQIGVFTADFGRVGLAICFDIDFPEVWQGLANHGAELVIWPSAYSGGAALQAHASIQHYYVVSATKAPDCTVYDITGEQLLFEKKTDINVSHIILDLDRGVYDRDAIDGREKCTARLEKLLKDHGEDVGEKYLERDDWFVLQARRPGVSARQLAHRYGLLEKRDLVRRSRGLIDKRRGWTFAKKVYDSPQYLA